MKTNLPIKDNTVTLCPSFLNLDRPIENFITSYLTSCRYSLTFGPDVGDISKSMVILLNGNEPVSSLKFDISRLKSRYKKINSYFKPHIIADTGEPRLAYEEVEEHRQKNGVKWNEVSHVFEINASFLGNLCMSYLIENRACIKINLDFFNNQYHYPKYYYVIEIIHLDDTSGFEKYAILKNKLLHYVR